MVKLPVLVTFLRLIFLRMMRLSMVCWILVPRCIIKAPWQLRRFMPLIALMLIMIRNVSTAGVVMYLLLKHITLVWWMFLAIFQHIY